jgi:hypothetical protein
VKGGYDDDLGINTPRFKEYDEWEIGRIFGRYCLDRLFWRAVADARSWISGDWKAEWRRFIAHLAEGKDAESFFAEPLK